MKEYFHEFAARYDFPEESVNEIILNYGKIGDSKKFGALLDDFYKEPFISPSEFQKGLNEICEEKGINPYTLYLIFFMCLSPRMKKEYEKAGLSDEIYHETVMDLKYKLIECMNVDKVVGVSPFHWHCVVFRMRVLGMGRLQYEINTYRGDDAFIGGRRVREGDKVIGIHIPSSQKPFDRESRMASYEMAYNFFKNEFEDNTPIFHCESWLLHPQNKEILGEKSNISSFIDDFKIVKSYQYSHNSDMWRIFGADAELPPDKLPRNTSLQRKMADWFLKGHKLGGGEGLFIFDPVNKKLITD